MKLDIKKEQLELMTDLDLEEILKRVDERCRIPYFKCRICFDKGIVLVCGGPDRPCPACTPRFK